MHKTVFFISALLILVSLKSVSQTVALSKQEALSVKESIIITSKKTTSIISKFVQSKHLSFLSKDIISKGNLVFKAPNLIKWEYNNPFKYSVIFKDNQLLINDDGIKSDIDLSANKAFKNLNNLIIKSVKGDMFDTEKFKIAYLKDAKNYLISFTSLDKSLKSFIHKFELTFDRKTFRVLKIKMMETTEDYTIITFSNQKINTSVSDAIFNN